MILARREKGFCCESGETTFVLAYIDSYAHHEATWEIIYFWVRHMNNLTEKRIWKRDRFT